jgi:hypothetical protein
MVLPLGMLLEVELTSHCTCEALCCCCCCYCCTPMADNESPLYLSWVCAHWCGTQYGSWALVCMCRINVQTGNATDCVRQIVCDRLCATDCVRQIVWALQTSVCIASASGVWHLRGRGAAVCMHVALSKSMLCVRGLQLCRHWMRLSDTAQGVGTESAHVVQD